MPLPRQNSNQRKVPTGCLKAPGSLVGTYSQRILGGKWVWMCSDRRIEMLLISVPGTICVSPKLQDYLYLT